MVCRFVTLIIAAAAISGCLSPNSNFSSWCPSGQTCSNNVTTTPSSSIIASPASVEADGVGTSTLTVTFLDSSGNPIVGQTASLSSSRGAVDTITTISGVTNTAGEASFSIKSSTTGTPTLTAMATAGTMSSSPLTFSAPVASASLSSMTTSGTPLNADGVATATITVTLLDANNVALNAKSVSLSSSRGATDVISPSSSTTNTSGQATFTVSSTHFGSSTFTAVDTTDGVTVSSTSSATFKGYRLVFSTEPSVGAAVTANLATSPVVSVEDATGFVDPSATGTISILAYTDSLCTNSVGGFSYSATSMTTGNETFNNFNFSTAGLYYLGASLSPYTSTCSNEIKIGPQLSPLYTFSSSSTVGIYPYGGVLLSSGTLYGMTYSGGSGSDGTIFDLNLSGPTYGFLHGFSGTSSDGSFPYGNVIMSGTILYGMTYAGGANGAGELFSYNLGTSTYTDLYDFSSASGDGPYGSLVMIGSVLYGLTSSGGANTFGTLFSYDTSTSTFNALHSFTGADGSNPRGSLIVSGTLLYGMTYNGGAHSLGTIFEYDTSSSTFTSLYSFTSSLSDAARPEGTPLLSGTTLYGLTSNGGTYNKGTVFSFDLSTLAVTLLHSFGNGSDGTYPSGSLVSSGTTLYGTTGQGGISNDGIIFSVGETGKGYTVLHSFAGGSTDGNNPGDLILSGSTFYGMSAWGGSSNEGIVYQF